MATVKAVGAVVEAVLVEAESDLAKVEAALTAIVAAVAASWTVLGRRRRGAARRWSRWRSF